ncbi:unnamed protein product [Nippostrongylus brasiliensis]|uniref:G-protein coupled receptor (inferred by orthology to a C. elegans protein) n=1 Tax=Nippostrongylus brasiliensis TaxID=27835 RepID=A0A0N4XT63_NIPBR|nr:unnamed protein product [Nippostrongylus brasiliensis]
MSLQISCRLLFLIQLRFLRLATFSWMLAEGVHLFRLLQSDSADSVPAVIAVIYGALRESLDNEGCWVSPSVNGWIESAIIIPCILALCFLFTIYRLPDLTHQVINLVLDGLQGCAVSIIFCYTNKSVWDCAKKWWKGVCDSRSVKADIRARMSIQHETKVPLVDKNEKS